MSRSTSSAALSSVFEKHQMTLNARGNHFRQAWEPVKPTSVVSHSDATLSRTALARRTFSRMSSALAVQTNGRHSILEAKAGELAVARYDEPWIELCGSCGNRFENWLRSGK